MKNPTLRDKVMESLTSILPIALIIAVLAFTVTPLDTGSFCLFLAGVLFLIFGMGLFTLGADMSLLVIGEKIGTTITKSGKIWLIALVSFVIGIIVTIAEPDLQLLARQVPSIGSYVLISVVAMGVGLFLMIAMLRIVFRIPLSTLLVGFYIFALFLGFFIDPSFRPLAFDAGGVTTGPMTVPFIISMGVGLASIRAGKGVQEDSFGLVALSSVGPIVAVLLLGIIFRLSGLTYSYESLPPVDSTRGVLFEYLDGLAEYGREVSIAILPVFLFFLLFQLCTRAFKLRRFARILMGFIYTFLGLALFLTGANVGFMPIGRAIGEGLAALWGGWLLIPVGMVIGYFVVAAEPAVHVLNRQVERMSAGAISASSMKFGLCAGVSVSLGLAMTRILTGLDILWFLVPGYAVALVLTILTPPVYTGIAFDSGGVASGAMVSSFVLPMSIGACKILAGEGAIMSLAFGCVAFVALTPLISIQILGIVYKWRRQRIKHRFLNTEERILEYEVD